MILKVVKNKALHSLQAVYLYSSGKMYLLKVTALIFLNKTSILDFAESVIYYSICLENTKIKNMTPEICFLVFAHVHHVSQYFGTRM